MSGRSGVGGARGGDGPRERGFLDVVEREGRLQLEKRDKKTHVQGCS